MKPTPLTTWACLAPLLVGVAQAVPQAPAATQAEEAKPARSQKQILHMTSGQIVRAAVREAEGGYEFKTSGKWTFVPTEMVDRVALEKDVVSEWKKRQKKARKEGISARAELGKWSFENGLFTEALGTIERVLEEAPNQKVALEAIGANSHRFAIPSVQAEVPGAEGTLDLRRWAASKAIATREMAILELASVRDREGLQGALAEDLFEGSVGRRLFAAHALRRLFPGTEAKRLIHRAVLDGSENVRQQAAFALRDANEVGLIVPVARAMESSHPKVRIHAAQALGNMGYASAVEPLMSRLSSMSGRSAAATAGHTVPHSYIFTGTQFAYIQDFDVEVAQFQAVAKPNVNVMTDGMVLEAGVHSVQHAFFAQEGRAIRSSLEQLTGIDVKGTDRAWAKWWDKNQDEWRAVKVADRPPTPPGE